MSDTINDYFAQRYAAATSEDQPSYLDASSRLLEKRQQLEESTQNKLKALRDAHEAYKLSQTAAGQLASLGTDNKYVRQGVQGIVSGTGLIAKGAGYLAGSEDAMELGNSIQDTANFIGQTQDTTFKARMANSTPTGDITDPSTWSMGDDFSAEGFAGVVTNLFGEMAPIIIGSMVSGGSLGVAGAVVGGAATGGLQAAGAGGDDASQYIDSLDDAQLANIPLYNKLLEQSGDPAQARETLKQEAAQTQAIVGGVVGGIGGGITGRLLRPFTGALGKGISGRLAGIGLTAAEESAQEVTESVAGRAAVNAVTGTDRDTTEGTFADAVLGAAGGVGISGVREAASLATGKTKKEIELEKFTKGSDALKTARESGDITQAIKEGKVPVADVVKAAIAQHVAGTNKPADSTKTPSVPTEEELLTSAQEVIAEADKRVKLSEKLEGEIEAAKKAGDTQKAEQLIKDYDDNGFTEEDTQLSTITPEDLLKSEQFKAKAEENIAAKAATKTATKTEAPSSLQELKQLRDFLNLSSKELGIAQVMLTDKDTLADVNTAIGKFDRAIAKAEQEGNTADVEKYTDMRNDYHIRKQLLESNKYPTKASIVQAASRLGDVKSSLEKLNNILTVEDTKAKAEVAPKVQEAVTKALDTNTPEAEKAKAVDDAVILLMQSPEAVTTEEIEGLMASPTLSPAKKNWLRTLSDANIARNSLTSVDGVNSEIMSRSREGNFKSLPEYVRDVREYLKTGNVEAVKDNLANLQKFAAVHGSKMAAINKAFAAAKQIKPENIQVVPVKEGSQVRWTTLTGKNKLSDSALKKAAGYKIHAGSSKFVNLVNLEVPAINKTLEMLRAEQAVYSEPVKANVEPAVSPTVSTPPVTTPEAAKPAEQAETKPETVTETVAEEAIEETVAEVTAESVPNPQTEEPSVEETIEETIEETVTEEVEESEVVEQEVEEEVVPTPDRVEGHLTLAVRKVKDLIKAYFTPKKDHLSNVQNHITKLIDSPLELSKVADSLDTNTDIRDKQLKSLRFLGRFMRGHGKRIQAITASAEPDYKHLSISQYLFEDGKLGTETSEAIAAGIHEVLLSSSTTMEVNTYEKVIKAYSRRGAEVDYFHPEFRNVMNKLTYGGTVHHTLIGELGKAAVDILGIKAHSKAPRQMQENLINELGTYALTYLKKSGFLEETTVSLKLMAEMGLGNDREGSNGQIILYKPRRIKNEATGRNELIPAIQQILDSTRGTKGFISKLFDIENARTFPESTPPEKAPSKVKKSLMDVPRELMKRLFKAQKQASYIREDMLGEQGIFRTLPREVIEFIAGIRSSDNLLQPLSDAVEGKNQGLQSEINNLYDFMESWNPEDPIYFKREVWTIQRVGLTSNVLNPLQSKVHRFAIKNEGADYKVPTSEKGKAYDDFRMAILEGLGVKTDKQTAKTSLKQWDKTINDDPEIAAAINELVKLADNKGGVDYEAIKVGVAKGDENFHSFDALWQYAQFKAAKARGDSSFTSTLTREADGVNNGPFLSFIQSGVLNLAGYEGWGNKGGFFTKEDIEKDPTLEFGKYAEDKSNLDLYQSIAFRAEMTLIAKDRSLSPFWLKTIGPLTEEGQVTKSARKIFKQPITEAVFGSTADKASNSIGHQALDNWIELVQKHYTKYMAGDRASGQEVVNLLKEFKEQVGVSAFARNPDTLKELKDIPLNFKAREMFIKKYQKEVGVAVTEAMLKTLAPFFETRNEVHKVASSLGDILNDVFVHVRNKHIEASPDIARDGKGNPLDDLTKESYDNIFKEIFGFAPIFATPTSAGGSVNTGIISTPLAKGRVDPNNAGSFTPYTGRVALDKAVAGQATAAYRGNKPEFSDAGARTFVGNIHSTDSYIASLVYQLHNLLNVHDAAIASPHVLEQAMPEYNRATMDVMINHSIPFETLVTLKRVRENLDAFIKREGLAKSHPLQGKLKRLAKLSKETYPILAAAERNRLEFLSKVKRVHQYAYIAADGAKPTYHDVTPEQEAKIQKLLSTNLAVRVNERLKKEGIISNTEDFAQPVNGLLEISADLQSQQLTAEDKQTAANITKQLEVVNNLRRYYVRTGNIEKAIEYVTNKFTQPEYAEALTQALHTATTKLANHSGIVKEAYQVNPALLSKVMSAALTQKLVPISLHDAWNKLTEAFAKRSTPFMSYYDLKESIREVTGIYPQPITELLTRLVANSNMPLVSGVAKPVPVPRKESKPVTPTATETPDLLTQLRSKPVHTLEELETAVRHSISTMEASHTRKIRAAFMDSLFSALPKDTKIHFITANTPKDAIPIDDVNGVHGFFHTGENYVALIDPDLSNKPLDSEVVLHELLHAATSYVLENPNKNSERIIKNLNELLSITKTAAIKAGKADTFKNALQSLDEFVSWGLSNAEFQAFMADIQLDPTQEIGSAAQFKQRGTNKLLAPVDKIRISALRAFVIRIAQLVFNKDTPTEQRLNALQALIVNGAALIEHASTRKFGLGKATESTILKMDSNTSGYTELTAEQTLEQLSNNAGLSPFKAAELKEVLTTVITSIHGPLGNISEVLRNQGKANPVEAFQQAIRSGDMPLYTSVNHKGIILDQASLYVTEQTDLAIRASLATSPLATKELKHLFDEAKEKVTPKAFITGDWNAATKTDRDTAERIHAAIFSYSENGVERRSGLLAQFAALALTYEPLKAALNYVPVVTEVSSDRLGDRIKAWFHNAMRSVVRYFNISRASVTAQENIMSLVTSMVRREQLTQQKIKEKSPTLESLLNSVQDLSTAARQTLVEKLKASNASPAKAFGSLLDLHSKGRMDEFAEQFELFRTTKLKGRLDFLGKLITEARGDSKHLNFALEALNSAKLIQKDRQHEISNISHLVQSFTGEVTDIESSALTRGLIRTDVSALLEYMPIPRILNILQNDKTLVSEIRMHEQSLASLVGSDNYFKNAAFALGHYLATDEVKTPLLSMNAYNIANKSGLNQQVPIELATKIEPVIDRLATLYALKRIPLNKRVPMQKYFNKQADAEKVLNELLQTHKGMVQSSKGSLFSGQATKVQKGYIKEIYDPFVSVVAAPSSEINAMKEHGYVLVNPLPDVDKVHPEAMSLYVSDTGGLATYNSAAFSLTGTRSKGYTADISKQNGDFSKLLQRVRTTDLKHLSSPDFISNFDQEDSGHIAPVFASNGAITSFRYLMTANTKDSLLNRDTRINLVLGAIAGSILDKPATKAHNEDVLRALLENWNAATDVKKGMYVLIGENATTPEYREKFAQLPAETKIAVKRIWGGNNFYVRKDSLDTIFGYRDLRLSDVLKKDETMRTTAQNIAAKIFLTTLGSNAVHRLDVFQDSWEYVVKHVKNVYVIRNLNTLVGNIISNMTLLSLYGVPMKDIVRNKLLAAEALVTYQKDSRELAQLRVKRARGLVAGMEKEVDDRIAELEVAIDTSPVHPLMEAGQFPSILEDLDEESTTYDFKPFLDKKLDKLTAKLPGPLVTAGQTLMVSEGTPLYKLLYKTTQMSDFTAKYALYVHLKNEGMEETAAQSEIREAFINYDKPSGQVLHALNKAGLLMFTKYFIGIQKVLFKLFKEHTARTLMLVLADKFLGGIPSVNDSWIFNRIGNPFDAGALEAFSAWDEPIVMKTVLSLLD